MFVTDGGGGADRSVGWGPRAAPSIPYRNESHCDDKEQPLGFTDLPPKGQHQRAELEKMRKSRRTMMTKGRDWVGGAPIGKFAV